jgi:hypothetical protein
MGALIPVNGRPSESASPKWRNSAIHDASDTFSIIDVSRVRVRAPARAREPRKKENASDASFAKEINVLGFAHTGRVGIKKPQLYAAKAWPRLLHGQDR